LCKQIQEQELPDGGIIAVRTIGVEPASIVVKRPNSVGIQTAIQGNGHDSNIVLEHGGESSYFIDAAVLE
jgi:hypothetical protein